ncbi:MAG: hypothetical protein WAX23_04370 [Methanosarcina sp.]
MTLTVKFKKNGIKNYVFANFFQINSLIVAKRTAIMEFIPKLKFASLNLEFGTINRVANYETHFLQ